MRPPFRASSPAPSGARLAGVWELATDADLAVAAATRDREGKEAFVEIVRRHQTAVCAVAWSVAGRIGLTDDIAQETFFEAWKRMATLREPAKLRAWLTRIAHHTAVDALKREAAHESRHGEDAGPPPVCALPTPDTAAAEAEEEALVWASLSALPETLRTPLVLFYREGRSVAAVAAALDLSEDAVKQRLSRGRRALRSAVESRIATVLGRIQPSALLLVTIASGIGLLTPPAAVAAGVTAGAATTSAGAATAAGTAGISTFMTTTSWFAAAVTMAAFLPLGWQVGGKARSPAAENTPPALPGPAAADDPFAAFPNSKLLAEWRRLHQTHGSNPAAMPVIYAAIQAETDAFRRDALNLALMTEWATVDPEGAFQNLWSEKKHTDHAALMMREWLKRDPDKSADFLLAGLSGAEDLATAVMGELAEMAPDRFIAVLSRLPQPAFDRYGVFGVPPRTIEVLEKFTLRHPDAAEEGLPLLKDSILWITQSCLATVMAKKDPATAADWASALESEKGRKAALGSVAAVWAQSDPAAALARFKTMPESRLLDERVLLTVSEKDLSGALRLWRESHGKVDRYVPGHIVSDAVDRELKKNPLATIQLLAAQPPEIQISFITESAGDAQRRYSRLSPENADAIWGWIRRQKPDGMADGIGNGMLVSEFQTDPQAAIQRLKSLPEEWQARLCTVADGMSNIRQLTDYLTPAETEQMLAAVGPAARGPLLAAVFGKTDPGALPDVPLWRKRLDELPPEARENAAGLFAGRLTSTDPEAALTFAESLPAGGIRQAAYASLTRWWSQRDAHDASAWLDTLPFGSDREFATAGLVESLPFGDAEAAFTWAATITDAEPRLKSLTAFVKNSARTHPDKTHELLEHPLLSATDREALRQEIAK